MRKFQCNCGAKIFFENSQCISCSSELGWCPSCNSLRTLTRDNNGQYSCGYRGCHQKLTKCYNYEVERVCNRCCVLSSQASNTPVFCDYCRFNDTIPDLSVEKNREKWRRIEVAKRRLLYTLDSLRLPYGNEADGVKPPLSFDFKGDIIPKGDFWRKLTEEERVYTGHANGKVTINIREADDVERETSRVSFEEAHRTVIGHFRHEMGHYFWDLLVLGKCEPQFIAVFGDYNNPDYSTAMETYYTQGPKQFWKTQYISAYASMHPWEDFAECFASYLDMVSVLEIANNELHINVLVPASAGFKEMADRYSELGIMFNEINRAIGLLDLVPEVFTSEVLNKMEFIHDLLRRSARSQ